MKISCFSFLLRISVIATAALVLVAVPARPAYGQRLAPTVTPSRYTLRIKPDLKAATFSGVESIDVNLAQSGRSITLNAAEIAFQSVTLNAAGKQQTATISLDKEKQQATFTFPNQIPVGKATLHIHYTGILNDTLRGFYLSKTARRNYAVTQFEPTDARRAFPSFDEPAFKAVFDISLVIDKGDTAISNSPIASDTPGPDPGKHTLRFYPTPKMSTYLVAFLVGDFQCTAGEQDGVALRVCSTPDKVSLTPYALSVAKFVLHYYNDYFGIHFPLKKLDLIGLPDFEAGAMENFGAITYRETDLLLDPKTATEAAKEEVALVVAHEMAHQWFGDLVTMKWWNNIWLNEGFATWMENKPVAAMHPEWLVPQTVAANEDSTLNLDALPTTRAIRAKADTPSEINQMFDGISYGKASDVLLMVENYLGPEVFQQGVRRYLMAHLYSNATAQDFWNAETAVSHKPVDKIMDSLVAQTGEPILTFGEPSNGQVSVSQKRFFLSPSLKPDPSQKWTLPVCFKTTGDGQECQLLTPQTTSLKVPSSALFFANARGKGYYRSAYASASYQALVAHVETGLPPTERINLTGDEWARTRAGMATIGDYLDLAAALKSDSNSAVVGEIQGGIEATMERAATTPEEKAALAAWIRRTFEPSYKALGAPSDSDTADKRQLRAYLFQLLGEYGKDPAVMAEAHTLAEKYLADRSSVDPNLGETALAVAARNGDAALFDQLQRIYETSTNPQISNFALRLLAEFENPTLAARALNYTISGKVRNQDAALQLAISLQIAPIRNQAWNFIQTHWDQIRVLLTPELSEDLVTSTGSFCSADAADQVQSFFATHKAPMADRDLKRAVDRINGCAEFRALQEPNLKQWLATQSAE